MEAQNVSSKSWLLPVKTTFHLVAFARISNLTLCYETSKVRDKMVFLFGTYPENYPHLGICQTDNPFKKQNRSLTNPHAAFLMRHPCKCRCKESTVNTCFLYCL